jgi:hypothetical protein
VPAESVCVLPRIVKFFFSRTSHHPLPLLSSTHRGEGQSSGWRRECTQRRFADNIADKNFESVLSYGSIDVVYTWVRREGGRKGGLAGCNGIDE